MTRDQEVKIVCLVLGILAAFCICFSLVSGCGQPLDEVVKPPCIVTAQDGTQANLCGDGGTAPAAAQPGATTAPTGHIVFRVTAAAKSMCRYGGKVVSAGIDLNGNGTLDASDGSIRSLALCSGRKHRDD